MINAAESMEDVQGRARILVIRSFCSETGRLAVTIEDSGAGVPNDPERLFDAFFTTKASGLGTGALDLPFHRRGPRRSLVGDAEFRPTGCNVSVRTAVFGNSPFIGDA
jgi:hypothetical protein